MFAGGRVRKELLKSYQIPSAKATSENTETSSGEIKGGE